MNNQLKNLNRIEKYLLIQILSFDMQTLFICQCRFYSIANITQRKKTMNFDSFLIAESYCAEKDRSVLNTAVALVNIFLLQVYFKTKFEFHNNETKGNDIALKSLTEINKEIRNFKLIA